MLLIISRKHAAKDSLKIINVGADLRSSQSIDIEFLYDGVHDCLVLCNIIGGSVQLVTHKMTGIEYALKYLYRRQSTRARHFYNLGKRLRF